MLNAPGHSPFESAHNHSMLRVRSGRIYFEILNYVISCHKHFFRALQRAFVVSCRIKLARPDYSFKLVFFSPMRELDFAFMVLESCKMFLRSGEIKLHCVRSKR